LPSTTARNTRSYSKTQIISPKATTKKTIKKFKKIN